MNFQFGPKLLVCWLALVILAARVSGQDADTMLLNNDAQKYTILSEVDAVESAGFLTMLRARSPAGRNQMATAFIKTYPQSWLLSQA